MIIIENTNSIESLESKLSELNFNPKKIREVTDLITICDEVYSKRIRKSLISYWAHIENGVFAYLEDNFRNVSALKIFLAHDFVEEGIKLGLTEKYLYEKITNLNLTNLELECIKLHTLSEKENTPEGKIKHLRNLLSIQNPLYSHFSITKGYDVCENSLNGIEFLSLKSAEIKEIQAKEIISFLNSNKKSISQTLNCSNSSILYLISRLEDSITNINKYYLFFEEY